MSEMKKNLLIKLANDEQAAVARLLVENGVNLNHLIQYLEKILNRSFEFRAHGRKSKREELEKLLLRLLETRMNFPLLSNIDDGGNLSDLESISLKRFLDLLA